MSLPPTIQINRPILHTRNLTPHWNVPTQPARNLRRAESALIDGMQARVRSGHGLTVLIGIDNPGPAFNYDLPLLQASAPVIASPYGLFTQLLTVASTMPGARAALRASAHSLRFILPQSLAEGARRAANDSPDPSTALLQLLQRLAGDTPLVIHFDNLQRADVPSLKLLRDVSMALDKEPILIVGTYHADQPYPVELGELLNDRAFSHASFAPIWINDLPVLLDALFGRKVPLGSMIEAVKNDDRLLLLGGVAVLEACRRSGRWTDGLTLSERVISLAQFTGAEYVVAAARLARSEVLIGLGQWAEAEAELGQVITSTVCAHDRNLTASAAWGICQARSKLDLPARNLFDSVRRWRSYGRTSDDPVVAAEIISQMIMHLIEKDQINEARMWQHDLETLVERSRHPAPRLAAALGSAAMLARTGDWRAAAGAYRAAIQHAATLHDLLYEARANSGLAMALLELGDAESKSEGRERLSVAHSVLSRLNARPDVEQCEAEAKRFGLRPRQRRPSAGNRTPGSLTRREREVLALVVNGLTNRQIAQRLTISEKTAEGHVGNILAKLSCSSRVKAAELARATGLLEMSPA